MSHDVNYSEWEVKIIELENHPDREISLDKVSRSPVYDYDIYFSVAGADSNTHFIY